MPLIVEPKAPPKPTAPKKKEGEFEFVGGRKSFSLPPLDVLECDKKERSELDKDAFLVTAEKLRANDDVQEFYLGFSGGERKSMRDVKHYKRRKRWLS